MAKKAKPYNDINKSRTLPNTKNKKNTSSSKSKTNKDKSKNLENTTRIRVDKERLNDKNSLDTSFLEGRVQSNSNRSKKEKEKTHYSKEEKVKNLGLLKALFLSLSVICVLLLVLLILFNNHFFLQSLSDNSPRTDINTERKLDDNYLFVGDFHTNQMNFEQLSFKYPYVKVADDEMTTQMILDDIHQKIYIYNPSAVFLELGVEDLVLSSWEEDIITRYREIIDYIQKNRSSAEIYVESLYPINTKLMKDDKYEDLSVDSIKSLNDRLESLADSMHVHYIDLYAELSDNDILKGSYTNDGIHLNDSGYRKAWKTLSKIADEVK